jgi:hypothetical protein
LLQIGHLVFARLFARFARFARWAKQPSRSANGLFARSRVWPARQAKDARSSHHNEISLKSTQRIWWNIARTTSRDTVACHWSNATTTVHLSGPG